MEDGFIKVKKINSREYKQFMEEMKKNNTVIYDVLRNGRIEEIHEDVLQMLLKTEFDKLSINYVIELLKLKCTVEWFIILKENCSKGEEFLDEVVMAAKNNIDPRFAKKYISESTNEMELFVYRDDFINGQIDPSTYDDVVFDIDELSDIMTESELKEETTTIIIDEVLGDAKIPEDENCNDEQSVMKKIVQDKSIMQSGNSRVNLYDRLLIELIGEDTISIIEEYKKQDSLEKAFTLLNKAAEEKVKAIQIIEKMKKIIYSQKNYINDLEMSNAAKEQEMQEIKNEYKTEKELRIKFEKAYMDMTEQINAVRGSISYPENEVITGEVQ